MRTTLGNYLDDFIRRGGETAFVHRRGLRSVRTSYGDVARSAFRISRELEERGVGKGDRVLLQGENGPEWTALFWGCVVRGAVVVPLDARSEPGFVARVAAQVEPKLAVVDSGGGAAVPPCPLARFDEIASSMARHPAEPRPAGPVSPDDTFEIVFTSGTTAEPKGVRVTHRNLLANLEPLEREIKRFLILERLVHPLRFLCLVPLSHVFGQIMGLFVPPMLGGEVFFRKELGPGRVIETIRDERISVLVAVPRMLDALREKIQRDAEAAGALNALRRAFEAERGRNPLRRWWRFRAIHARFGWKFWAFISGGAALAPGTEEFWDRLGFAVIQGYGMTETASLITVNHPFKLARGSIGKPMPGQTVKLAPDGEILVRGENVSPGYWKEEDGAAKTADGWFRTGDVGEMDREGNLYFKGRTKEVIVTAAGTKIHPGDVEQAFDREPEVKVSAVVSAEGAGGPEPLAVLVLRQREIDVAALVDRVNGSLAPHQRVRRWFVWPGEDFPRTSTRKVQRGIVAAKALAAMAGASHGRGRAEAASDEIGGIVSRIGGAAREAPDPSARLGLDLKLDSLGRVELVDALEDRYDIEIDEAALTETTTLGELGSLVREGGAGRTAPYPYPRWQQRAPAVWLRLAILHLLAMPAARLLGRQRTSGAERLGDVREALVFVCNHVTAVDHALVLAALPRRMRGRTAIAMDGEILRGKRRPPAGTGPLGRMFNVLQYVLVVLCFNVFSMPRKSGFRRSFEFAGRLIDRGYNILVFPEGRYTTDGAIGPFMPGAGLLVSQLRAPVIPVRIDGLWELKRAKRRRARPGEISVLAGEPVRYDPDDPPERIAADLRERVLAISRITDTRSNGGREERAR